MKYTVLYWDDDSDPGEWQVYWWGTSKRKADKAFNAACGMFRRVQLHPLTTCLKEQYL